MNHKTTDLDSVISNSQPLDFPETIAKNKKEAEREKSRKMRRYFEQKREQEELDKQLKDPFDDYDFDD